MVGPESWKWGVSSHTQISAWLAMSAARRRRTGSPRALNMGAIRAASVSSMVVVPRPQQVLAWMVGNSFTVLS